MELAHFSLSTQFLFIKSLTQVLPSSNRLIDLAATAEVIVVYTIEVYEIFGENPLYTAHRLVYVYKGEER